MKRREFLKTTAYGTASLIGSSLARGATEGDQDGPNILWIKAEDICPDLSCYGTAGVETPHLDRLAEQGARYEDCYVTAPVCSPSRTAMMLGMYPSTVGGLHHRTPNRGQNKLPKGVRPLPHHLRDAGYFTALGCGHHRKKDLNFRTSNLFDGNDWSQRAEGQPFYGELTLPVTHRSFTRDEKNPIGMDEVKIPPYYPDHRITRRDWANYLESMQVMDRQVGEVLQRLEEDGLAENTVVVFMGDHGRCMPRGKQFLYDGGVRVPLIIRWPGRIEPGTVSEEMISAIDVTASVLQMATGEVPEHVHGRPFLEPSTPERDFIYAARGKMDRTHDSMRAVRSADFKYILNLMPERAWCQYNAYKERSYPVLALLNVMYLEGRLNEEQERFMLPAKPREELYDLQKDPHETRNVACDSDYREDLMRMRQRMRQVRERIGDQGPGEKFRQGGWPDTYPTHSLETWKKALQMWEEYLFGDGPGPDNDLLSVPGG